MRCRHLALLGVLILTPALAAEAPRTADVVVYGGTPAGIAAALAAADDGCKVILVEPTPRIGGLITSGLSHADFRTFESLTGAYREFTQRVMAHYAKTYGPDSPQAKGNFRGTHAEPKVNLAVFEAMLAERKVNVLRSHVLDQVLNQEKGPERRIVSITVLDDRRRAVEIVGQVYIDGTYEGDLMAAAKVPFRVGREGRDAFGESLAPEKGDEQLQGYNFRLIATKVPENRVPVSAPPGYNREDFVGLLPLIEAKKITRAFGAQGEPVIFKAQDPPLPNGKYDINDVSRGIVRLSLPSENLKWPTGTAEERQKIFDEHRRWNVGLWYFLANDKSVPEAIRSDARQWGLCKDEFTETGHLPPQLYVREARRMKGQYVFTQNDVAPAKDDARSVLRADAIASGDYGPNCHGTAHEGSRFGGKHTGEFYHPVAPYQMPYGVLISKDVANLLVPGAMSASHVGFCALRLEPIWMSLGQASGHAEKVSVQKVPVPKLQDRLHRAGSATIYTSDVPHSHPDFVAVQWWGTLGGLHGLQPAPEKPGQRGKQIIGQYYEAFPGHAVELDRVVSPDLAERWTRLAVQAGVPAEKCPKADGKVTRGDWIRAVARAR
jgi:hypothetical protein